MGGGMLSISRTKVLAGVGFMLGALALEGCARHAVEPTATYGSIKDDAPGGAAVHKTAARGAGASQPVHRSAMERSPGAGDTTVSAGATSKAAHSTSAEPASVETGGPAARIASATAGASQGGSETTTAAAGIASMARATPEAAVAGKPKLTGADRIAASQQPAEALPASTERLLIQGRQLFQAGKVQEARKRFIAALNGLSPEATLELARTFDTHYLSKLGLADGAPDIQRALQLYKSAVERGSEAAKADLARVEATLNTAPNAVPK